MAPMTNFTIRHYELRRAGIGALILRRYLHWLIGINRAMAGISCAIFARVAKSRIGERRGSRTGLTSLREPAKVPPADETSQAI
jgi:hypothetical protein